MYARKFLPATFALAVLVAGCTPATPPAAPDTRDADAKAIRQSEAGWSPAFAAKDADKIVSFYADDASVFLSGIPVVTGKANLEAKIRKDLSDKNFSVSFPSPSDRVVVSKSGDLAYTQGSYTVTYTDPKTKRAVSEKSKYVEVYMKQADGSWKIVADIGNADGPATPVKK
jgi:uncharacterized protein (TIGR02246 family)